MADVYKDEVQTDETGRILHIKTTEHVTASHPLAVQALEVERSDRRGHGASTEVLDADHPLAVQALPVEDHPLLRRLESDHADELRASRDAADDYGPETEESIVTAEVADEA